MFAEHAWVSAEGKVPKDISLLGLRSRFRQAVQIFGKAALVFDHPIIPFKERAIMKTHRYISRYESPLQLRETRQYVIGVKTGILNHDRNLLGRI